MTKTLVKTQKQVQIIARVQIKRNGIVVYKVRSSNGADIYETTFYNGKACSCSCPSKKPCYHMVQLQEREDARKQQEEQAAQKLLDSILNEDLEQHIADEHPELDSCDTCGRLIKKGTVTCYKCLGC